jgi:hypothetical protein
MGFADEMFWLFVYFLCCVHLCALSLRILFYANFSFFLMLLFLII